MVPCALLFSLYYRLRGKETKTKETLETNRCSEHLWGKSRTTRGHQNPLKCPAACLSLNSLSLAIVPWTEASREHLSRHRLLCSTVLPHQDLSGTDRFSLPADYSHLIGQACTFCCLICKIQHFETIFDYGFAFVIFGLKWILLRVIMMSHFAAFINTMKWGLDWIEDMWWCGASELSWVDFSGQRRTRLRPSCAVPCHDGPA